MILSKIKINYILAAMLGSKTLASKWWDSPNRAFDMHTPREMYDNGYQEMVSDYVVSFYDKVS